MAKNSLSRANTAVSQMAACLIRGCLSEEDTSSVFAYSLRDQRLAVILQFPLQQKLE